MTNPLTFDVIRKPSALTIYFSSTMGNIDNVDTEVKKLLGEKGLNRHSFAIRVVMREGLTNSVRHAHNYNPEKIIRFEVKIENSTLTMTIEDQGEGFDWRSYRRSINPDSGISKPQDHGRGFPIMEDYVDEYWYNEKGNILILKKDISS